MEHLIRMQLAYDLTQARKREKTIKVKRYQEGLALIHAALDSDRPAGALCSVRMCALVTARPLNVRTPCDKRATTLPMLLWCRPRGSEI
jgi:hypothetical protein